MYLNFEEVLQASSFLFLFSLVFTTQGASLVLLNLGILRARENTGIVGHTVGTVRNTVQNLIVVWQKLEVEEETTCSSRSANLIAVT